MTLFTISSTETEYQADSHLLCKNNSTYNCILSQSSIGKHMTHDWVFILSGVESVRVCTRSVIWHSNCCHNISIIEWSGVRLISQFTGAGVIGKCLFRVLYLFSISSSLTILLQSNSLGVLHSYSLAVLQSCILTVLHSYSPAFLQSCCLTILHIYSPAVLQSCILTVLQSYNPAFLQSCSVLSFSLSIFIYAGWVETWVTRRSRVKPRITTSTIRRLGRSPSRWTVSIHCDHLIS